ncbi:unnamed protein product [Cyclocybe aegerita]|uniref:Prolyl endopeptidase n=1 Tax=Cyclocybe aegerita TaxID=1973307 RepID=A0A8S0VT63_CYCAE|nr:unnamed protein product [Cyclocybe aegerita]
MAPTPWIPNQYPTARHSDHVDRYKSAQRGDVAVPDPYNWLENDTDETDKWTTSQEQFTRAFLDKNPHLDRLENVFRDCNNFAKFSAPKLYDDGRWYWFYNSGLEPQTAMYRSIDSKLPDFANVKGSGGDIFFDVGLVFPPAFSLPLMLSTSEAQCSLLGRNCFASHLQNVELRKVFRIWHFVFLNDLKATLGLAGIQGSDCMTIYVRPSDSPLNKEVDMKNDTGRFPEEIKFVKFSSITWTPGSEGFFYQRYPGKNGTDKSSAITTDGDLDAMIYYHRLGTSQAEDVLVYQDKENREWMFSIEVTEDDKYLILYLLKDSSRQNLLWIADYDTNGIGPNIQWRKVVNKFEAEYDPVANKGSVFYIRTNKLAPQYKVITIDIAKGNETKDLIPESEAYLSSVLSVNKDYFAITYKRNVKDELYVYSHEGRQLTRLAEDFVGAISVSGREKQSWFFATMHGFTSPGTVGRYDFTAPEGQRWSILRSTQLNGLDANDFEARQVWFDSKDGTKVPMFVVRHKSTKFDGTAPALQYGYGGFSISIDPFFSATILTFLQKYGAVLAVPNIRGGGEFGEEWHKAGSREKKGNCFDDFIAATEYLVKNNYAAPGKVTINGGSNGGLLVSACVNRAPAGTFGCAIAEVGVHDLLKFHKFTIGKAWSSDYGNPDDPSDFDFIFPLSPLHNIPTNKMLPPYLLLTADHDDRVVPMHSFKLAATLQHLLPHNPNPLLIRVDKKAGHGAGKSTQQKIKENADKYGFIAQTLGLEWKEAASL